METEHVSNSSRPVIKDSRVTTRRLNHVKYLQDDIPVSHVPGTAQICIFTLQ